MELKRELTQALEEMHYLPLLPIQEEAYPLIMSGKHLFLQAKTGSGKTAAYLIPLLQKTEPLQNTLTAVIIAPSRELALQIRREAEQLASWCHIRTACVIGGEDERKQINALKNAQIITATAGRLLDLFQKGYVDISHVTTLVMDEADQIILNAQAKEMEELLTQLPQCQKICVSATWHSRIKEFMPKRYEKLIADEGWNENIASYYIETEDRRKTLDELLAHLPVTSAIVFLKHRTEASQIARELKQQGILCAPFSAFYDEHTRRNTLDRFRKGEIRVLIATDAAARGLDIPDVSHVIHYDLPEDTASLIHRAGRSAHQQNTGTSISLLKPDDTSRTAAWLRTNGTAMEPDFSIQNDLSEPLIKESKQKAHVRRILIRAGKKDKIRPGDIAGALSAILPFEAIGTIEVQDRYTLVTIPDDAVLPERIDIKGKSRKIEESRAQ